MAQKKIFNSLGSNYDWQEAREMRKIWGERMTEAGEVLVKKRIAEYLGQEEEKEGKAERGIYLFYKAREALEAGCRMIGAGQKGKWAVAVTGFTCYVVERAIRRAGGEVVFVDLGENQQLNFGLTELKAAYRKNPEIKAVLLQNTFGLQMKELEEVVAWSRKEGLMVIEDSAHNVGAKYKLKNGQEKRAGSWGDMAIISFSQDKTVDCVSGGCLIINNPVLRSDFTRYLSENQMKTMPIAKEQQKKDGLYAWRTWWIRNGYSWGIGKVWHWWWKRRKGLSNPMQYLGDEEAELHEITGMAGRILEEKFKERKLEAELARRRRIAMIYFERLGEEKRWAEVTAENIKRGDCVRYPIRLKSCQERTKLIKQLEKRGFYLSDVWYDVVVAPRRYFGQSKYRTGDCPRGEAAAEVIFNLPTHKNISEKAAAELAMAVIELTDVRNENSRE